MLKITKPGLAKLSSHVIYLTLTVCFFLTPLLVLRSTSELFELNKMYLVYLLAAILVTAEVIKVCSTPIPNLSRPPLLKTGLIFILALTLATIFSIDHHVSFFGYYDRFHGGLWSWLSYATIFFSLSQLPAKLWASLIKISLISGLLVASWGILEHFGIDASYWVQDVRARVFSTIGQPNWLAAYLAMLLPWGVGLYLMEKSRPKLIGWLVVLLVTYTCFVFTYSRAGSLGLGIGGLIFVILLGWGELKKHASQIAILLSGLVAITVIFATPLASSLFKTAQPRTTLPLVQADETTSIRLAVWPGAWEIFKHYPLLGSGLETFGESFYQFRPVQMNQTSEWDFIFNKAHNEYLNYLATTGLVGTGAYVVLILSFFWQAIKLVRSEKSNSERRFLIIAAVSSTSSYLVQNMFSFTVVPLALLFVLNLSVLSFNNIGRISFSWPPILELLWSKHLQLFVLLPFLLLTTFVVNLWRADILYAIGLSDYQYGATSVAERELLQAIELNPMEPNYLNQFALVESSLATGYKSSDTGKALALVAERATTAATNISPYNLQLWRSKGVVMDNLATVDPIYTDQARSAKQQAVILAPTEPKVRYELAQFYESSGQTDLALATYLKSLELKDNYLDSIIMIVTIYIKQGQPELAKTYLVRAKEIDPTDLSIISLSQKVGL